MIRVYVCFYFRLTIDLVKKTKNNNMLVHIIAKIAIDLKLVKSLCVISTLFAFKVLMT